MIFGPLMQHCHPGYELQLCVLMYLSSRLCVITATRSLVWCYRAQAHAHVAASRRNNAARDHGRAGRRALPMAVEQLRHRPRMLCGVLSARIVVSEAKWRSVRNVVISGSRCAGS